MSNPELTALNARFGVAGQVSFREPAPGFFVVDLANDHATVTVALQGAQLLTWAPRGQQAVVWQSPHARFVSGKSVRGGVPVCWPWFGANATESTLPAHGFARTVPWEMRVCTVAENGGMTRLEFHLVQTDATRRMWPHPSELELHMSVGAALNMELLTRNTGTQAFTLGQALHTYFAVSDIREVEVQGLDGCSYLDKVGPEQRRQQHGPVRFSGETDRIYLDTEADCLIHDPGLQRRIRVSKRGSRSTVVWNPWIAKAASLGDMGEDGYLHMLCVESTNAADDVVTVMPGGEQRLAVSYTLETLDQA